MWVLGILTFLVPAGLAVVELGNLWPGQGGVYIWAYRTMGEKMSFLGGYLSWVPVILNTASSPAIVLQFLLLAFHAELGLTVSIVLQLVILWTVVGSGAGETGRQPTDHERDVRRVRRAHADDLHLRADVRGRQRLGHAVQLARCDGSRTSPVRASCTARCCCTWSASRRRSTWARSSCRSAQRRQDDRLGFRRSGGDLPADDARHDDGAAERSRSTPSRVSSACWMSQAFPV